MAKANLEQLRVAEKFFLDAAGDMVKDAKVNASCCTTAPVLPLPQRKYPY